MSTAHQQRDAVTTVPLLRYGLIALPLAFAGLPLYMHAPAFYAQYYGVSLAALAVALLFLRVIDAFQDPVIGWLGDRYAAHRPAVIAAALVVLSGGMLMLFHPYPGFELLWFCTAMIITATAFSVLVVHVNALGGLWTADPYEKTKITTVREGFILAGILLAAVLPVLLENVTDAKNALPLFAVLTAVLTMLCGIVFWTWLSRQDFATAPPREKMRLSALWRIVTAERIRGFFLVYFISALASAFPLVLFLFFVSDYLEAQEWTGAFLAVYFLSGIAAMPFWLYLSRRSGKIFAWGAAMLLAVAAFIWVATLQAGDTLCFAAVCFASGLALGAGMSLPPSILSDIIDAENNRDYATGQFSALAFLSKLALAVAGAAGLFGIESAGYDVSRSFQNSDAARALLVYYGIIPCGIQLVALGGVVLWYKKHGKGIYATQNFDGNKNTHHYGGSHVS
ncbi:MAG: MFS transporter [Micavibrio sp.]|nr:MAG: MFS transporter [Micavibrio sp.]